MPPSTISTGNPDVAVVGGGIIGLWTALEAARQGLSVTLLEKARIGAGASGGLLGALMPHQPTGWNPKKQFQLDGLLSLEARIADLETLTGLTAGYRRCGRLMPIRNAEKRRQSMQWADASAWRWPQEHAWRVADATPDAGWLPPGHMPHGANSDTLSARLSPRKLLAALRAAIATEKAGIREGSEVTAIGRDGTLTLKTGERLQPGHTILCAGWEGFALLDPHCRGATGRGVKGQAALLRPVNPVDPALPILYDNGTYAIAHEDGTVAVGSTSEDDFADPASTDDLLAGVIAAAQALCPALENAQVIERWAGIRPRAAGRDPLVGPLPGAGRTIVATGGFKITFGIAHLMAEAALAFAAGGKPDFLPETFLPGNRLTPRRN